MLTLIHADDWEGLFKDGELVAEGHSISVEDFAKIAGVELSRRETTSQGYDYLFDYGNFPKSLTEFEGYEQSYKAED